MDKENNFLDLLESDQNDPNVQYALGRCYLRGEGVEQNGQEADKWLRRAAEQGHEEAAALLASIQQETASEKALTEETLPEWCLRAEEGDPEAQYQVADYFQQNAVPGTEADVKRYLKMAVDQGHPQACLVLGRQLLETNPEEAVRHLRNAADCGILEAMELLGQCYARGTGVKKDLDQAETWFCTMAQRGGGEAMLTLALRYRWGKDVPRSMGRALSWLKRAQLAGLTDAAERYHAQEQAAQEETPEQELLSRAEAGDPDAQNRLGAQYAEGDGVPQDWEQAVEWFEKGAQQGNAIAQYNLSTCFCNGTGVEKDLQRSVEWLYKSAEQGYVQAQYTLALRYYRGEVVKQNPKQAAYWAEQAANQEDPQAQNLLSWLFYKGTGVEQDLEKSIFWMRKAAEQNHAESEYTMAWRYYEGDGVLKDPTQVVYWLQKCAVHGHANGQGFLGFCYDFGYGTQQNLHEAVHWYTKAAEQGVKVSQKRLAECLEQGLGVERDLKQAAYWRKKAQE